MVAIFGRPKKEALPDMRAEAVVLELEWETDNKSQQILSDAKCLLRWGMFGVVFVGVNDRLMTRWTRPDTKVIYTFFWEQDEWSHLPKRMINVDLSEFNKSNSEARAALAAAKKPKTRTKGKRKNGD